MVQRSYHAGDHIFQSLVRAQCLYHPPSSVTWRGVPLAFNRSFALSASTTISGSLSLVRSMKLSIARSRSVPLPRVYAAGGSLVGDAFQSLVRAQCLYHHRDCAADGYLQPGFQSLVRAQCLYHRIRWGNVIAENINFQSLVRAQCLYHRSAVVGLIESQPAFNRSFALSASTTSIAATGASASDVLSIARSRSVPLPPDG